MICINYIGGCYGSTGPGSVNPETGKAFGGSFPRISVSDIVDSQMRLLDHLGVEALHVDADLHNHLHPPPPSPCRLSAFRQSPSPVQSEHRATVIVGIQDVKLTAGAPTRTVERARSRHHSLVLHPIVEKAMLEDAGISWR